MFTRLELLEDICRQKTVSGIYLKVTQTTICCRQFIVGFYFN